MTTPLSPDLRIVEVEGMSCRAAAGRFGVALSTAVELLRQRKATGTREARPQGSDRRSAPIEAHAEELVALIEARPDITLTVVDVPVSSINNSRSISMSG